MLIHESSFRNAGTAFLANTPKEEFIQSEVQALSAPPSNPQQFLDAMSALGVPLPSLSEEEIASRAQLTDRARNIMITTLANHVYRKIPVSKNYRYEKPTAAFVDMVGTEITGRSYDDLLLNGTPEEEKEFFAKLLRHAHTMLPEMIKLANTLSEEELLERFPEIYCFQGFAFETENIMSTLGLRNDPQYADLGEIVQDLKDANFIFNTPINRMDNMVSPYYQYGDYTPLRYVPQEEIITYTMVNHNALENDVRGYLMSLHNWASTLQMEQMDILPGFLADRGFKENPNAPARADLFTRMGLSVWDESGKVLTAEEASLALTTKKPVFVAGIIDGENVPRLLTITISKDERSIGKLDFSDGISTLPELFFNLGTQALTTFVQGVVGTADKHVVRGSKEYDLMKIAMNNLSENLTLLEGENLSQRNVQYMKDLLEEASQRAQDYLDFKTEQRGKLVGKNEREQARIDAALQVKEFARQKLEQLSVVMLQEGFEDRLAKDGYQSELAAKATEYLPDAPDSSIKGQLENSARRSARALARIAEAGEPRALTSAEQSDARIHMARLVVALVVNIQGKNSPMKALYAQSPTKFIQDYANSKSFKELVGNVSPESVREFLQEDKAAIIAQDVVKATALSAPRRQAPQNPQPQVEKAPGPMAP